MFLLQSLPPLRAATHSRLYLCRHGETYSNSEGLLQGSGVDAQLNPTGRGQAASLAKELAFVQLDLVASSTLLRAEATADIGAAAQHAKSKRWSSPGFAEMYYGSIEGLPIASCRTELGSLTAAWKTDTSVAVGGDGESPDALLARAQQALWGGGLLGSS